ncbi:MAG: hypothetical protein J5755_05715 [Clostridia bacterium]|nr:hypothetical protein [Clostridia bacterium]
MKPSKTRKWYILLTVALVAAMLLVCLAPLMEAHHDCSGEDCPICEMLLTISKVQGAAILLLVMLGVVLGILTLLTIPSLADSLPVFTLITSKTKLSN